MRSIKIFTLFTVTFLLSAQVHAYMVNDNYWGNPAGSYGDVIGSDSIFNIHGIDLSLTGTTLTVDIFTNFAGEADYGHYGSTHGPNLTNRELSGYGNGIGYGDLFLATSWNPYGTAPYAGDDNSNGTVWEYGFALDNRWAENGGQGTLYQLNGTNNENANLAEDYLSGGFYRTKQEVGVDTDSQTVSSTNINGNWYVFDDFIRMEFDIAGTDLEGADEIALHWAMTCGNDTMEGSWTVPEPSTLSLMGLSLLVIGFIGRRKRFS